MFAWLKGLEVGSLWKTVLRVLTMALLLPVLPVMAVPGAGGSGESQDDAGEDDSETDDDQEDAGDDEEGEEDDEEWEPARAMRTIRTLREQERTLQKELKQAQSRLQQFEEAEEAERRQQMSEAERLQTDLEQEQAARREAELELHEYRLRDAFDEAAGRLEVAFANQQARRDAFALALPDLAEVDLSDEGKARKSIERVLKDLQDTRPHLFAEDGARTSPGTPPRGRRRTPTPQTTSPTETTIEDVPIPSL